MKTLSLGCSVQSAEEVKEPTTAAFKDVEGKDLQECSQQWFGQ
jgi:hypothetical protein